MTDIFIHSDLFCVNLYLSCNKSPINEAMAVTSEALSSCSKGLILAVDRSMATMSRMWCLWEVFLCAYRKGEISVRLALPGECQMEGRLLPAVVLPSLGSSALLLHGTKSTTNFHAFLDAYNQWTLIV